MRFEHVDLPGDGGQVLVRVPHVVHDPQAELIATFKEWSKGGKIEGVVGDEAAARDYVDDIVACGSEGVDIRK